MYQVLQLVTWYLMISGPINDVAELIFDREQTGNLSFWSALNYL